MARLLAWYSGHLAAAPARTKMLTGFTIFGSSDPAAQYVEHAILAEAGGGSGFAWDARRTARQAAFGCGISFVLHRWWAFLDPAVNRILPVATAGKWGNTLPKVFFDQALGATFFNLAFFSSSTMMEGKSPAEAWAPARTHVPKQLTEYHWRFWPLVHTVNFGFVPLQFRVLVQNTFMIPWSGFLSVQGQRAKRQQEADADGPAE